MATSRFYAFLAGRHKLKRLSPFLSCLPFVCLTCVTSACDPVTATVGSAAVVGSAAAQDRGVKGVWSDTNLRTKINYRWLRHESVLIDRVTLSVLRGRVVLTGTVENEALKQRAEGLIKNLSGIQSLTNAIKVGKPESFRDYSRDSWITTKLWTNLKLDKEVAREITPYEP